MHKTFIDIPAKTRTEIVALLQPVLASAVDLGVQAKLAHWNIRGPNFIALHELFDKITDAAHGFADEIAERIGQLGSGVTGNIQETAKASQLPKMDSATSAQKDVVTALAKSLAAFSKSARKAIGEAEEKDDAVTADILTTITGENDKNLWFVESHLQ